MTPGPLAQRLRQRIESHGPIAVSDYVDAALYDAQDGFYVAGGRAGGARGDFITAPEVGPLFGAVIARMLDQRWTELGEPATFCVTEWGAGPGTLARSVLDARPPVLVAGALRWCAVEISAAQRASHPDHPAVSSGASPEEARRLAGLGDEAVSGVVLANELLDNLPFDVFEVSGDGWYEHRVATSAEGFTTVTAPAAADVVEELGPLLSVPADGPRLVPRQSAARVWLREAIASLVAGTVVVLDYGAPTADLVERGAWLRTHRLHDNSNDWLVDPGSCDITTDVALDQLQLDHAADLDRSQADFLRAHGIDGLVEEGRRQWEATAHIGDLRALKARSRVRESEALLDMSGMGAFRVLEWVVRPS